MAQSQLEAHAAWKGCTPRDKLIVVVVFVIFICVAFKYLMMAAATAVVGLLVNEYLQRRKKASEPAAAPVPVPVPKPEPESKPRKKKRRSQKRAAEN